MALNYCRIIGNTNNIWLDGYILVILISSILGYLSIRGWTNTTLFLLLLPALIEFNSAYRDAKKNRTISTMLPIIITMLLPLAAILLSQTLRHEWIAKAYDGPARIMLSIPLLFYFTYKKIDFAKLLSFSAPLALLILVPLIYLHPEHLEQWGGRYATVFVDPNALGIYALVLSGFCLFSMEIIDSHSRKLLILQALGLLAGLYLIAGSGTRSSMLAIFPLLLLWTTLKFRIITPRLLFTLFAVLVISVVLIMFLHPSLLERFFSGFSELSSWLDGSNRETSTGLRLTMWQISWELFRRFPLYGYGDMGFSNYLNESWITSISSPLSREIIFHAGPHNEFLANLLRSGFLGGISVLCLFFVPLSLFWRNRQRTQTYLASHLGLAFITCLMFCSVSNEVLTLKYTNTFYGLTIAGLAAQVIRTQTELKKHESS